MRHTIATDSKDDRIEGPKMGLGHWVSDNLLSYFESVSSFSIKASPPDHHFSGPPDSATAGGSLAHCDAFANRN
jgi:hypothetical protein